MSDTTERDRRAAALERQAIATVPSVPSGVSNASPEDCKNLIRAYSTLHGSDLEEVRRYLDDLSDFAVELLSRGGVEWGEKGSPGVQSSSQIILKWHAIDSVYLVREVDDFAELLENTANHLLSLGQFLSEPDESGVSVIKSVDHVMAFYRTFFLAQSGLLEIVGRYAN